MTVTFTVEADTRGELAYAIEEALRQLKLGTYGGGYEPNWNIIED